MPDRDDRITLIGHPVPHHAVLVSRQEPSQILVPLKFSKNLKLATLVLVLTWNGHNGLYAQHHVVEALK